MGVDAGPWPVPGLVGQSSAHGVESHIAQRSGEMGLVHDDGAVTALPEMTGAPQSRVNMAGIAAMHRRQGSAQSVLVRRGQDQMDVIGHQHPRPHRDPGGSARFGQQGTVQGIILVAEEYLRPTVAALGDMMRETRNDEAGQAAHGPLWQDGCPESIKCTVTVIERQIEPIRLLGHPMYLEDGLGDVQTDRDNLVHGRPPL